MDEELLRGKGLEPEGGELAGIDDFALRIGQRAALVPKPGAWPHLPRRNGAYTRARGAGWIGFIGKRADIAGRLRATDVVVETPSDIRAALWRN